MKEWPKTMCACGHMSSGTVLVCGECWPKFIGFKERCESFWCAYCTFGSALADGFDKLTEHLKVCEFHPARKMEAEIAHLREVDRLREDERARIIEMDMDERRAFKDFCDGNRAPWVERRLAKVAYRILISLEALSKAQGEGER